MRLPARHRTLTDRPYTTTRSPRDLVFLLIGPALVLPMAGYEAYGNTLLGATKPTRNGGPALHHINACS